MFSSLVEPAVVGTRLDVGPLPVVYAELVPWLGAGRWRASRALLGPEEPEIAVEVIS